MTPAPYRVHLYRDRKGGWRWTIVARNGRKVATCGEGYTRSSHAKAMVRKLFRGVL